MKNDYVVRKLYISFIVVSILSALAATLGMLVDNIIVGRYLGTAELGAMGIIGPITLIFSACGNICSGGATVRASQALGRGEKERVNQIFTSAIIYVFLIGGIITILGLIFTDEIAILLGARGELVQPSVAYLQGIFLGTIPTIMTTALMGFIKIDGSPKLPLVCIISMTVCNIVLDLLVALVFEAGMFGMALATCISYVAAVLTACVHFTKKTATLRLALPKHLWYELKEMVVTGAPTAINRICTTFQTMMLNNILVAFVGVGAVTALNARTTASNFFGSLIFGTAQASVPIVSMFYGEEDKNALRSTVKAGLKIGIISNIAVGVLLIVIAPLFSNILGIYDPALSEMTVAAIRMYGVSMPFTLVNMLLMSYYQSTRSTPLATAICVMQAFAFTIVFSLALVRPMGAWGIWLSFVLAELLTIAVVVICTMIKNKSIPKSIDDFLWLNKDFGENAADRLELSIGNSMDEVMEISQGIFKFGKGRSISKRMLNLISLSIEEMAGNIVQHAFKPGEKKWFDLMVLDKPDSVVVRLRDNGAAFDPVAYSYEQSDEKYGINLISAISTTFEYRRSLGLNILMITLLKDDSEKTQ